MTGRRNFLLNEKLIFQLSREMKEKKQFFIFFQGGKEKVNEIKIVFFLFFFSLKIAAFTFCRKFSTYYVLAETKKEEIEETVRNIAC